MRTRKGRRIAIATVLAVVVIAGALIWLGCDHIRFFLAFESLGRNAQGYAEYRHRQTGIVFVSLPGGTFEMGAPRREIEEDLGKEPFASVVARMGGEQFVDGAVSQEHRHEVTVSPFLIAKYELTQAEWTRVMGALPRSQETNGSSHPVQMTWYDAERFCQTADLDVPSEAQWEYACRAGTTGRFGGSGQVDEMAWYDGNSERKQHPVGEKKPNHFGLFDMHGNVSEWCLDDYESRFYLTPQASQRDPVCRSGSESGVARGGDSWQLAHNVRSATRSGLGRDTHGPGLRPVFNFVREQR